MDGWHVGFGRQFSLKAYMPSIPIDFPIYLIFLLFAAPTQLFYATSHVRIAQTNKVRQEFILTQNIPCFVQSLLVTADY